MLSQVDLPGAVTAQQPNPGKTGLGMLSDQRLHEENVLFRGTGGVSAENQAAGFQPAFKDMETGKVYLSCFSDGRFAPMHLIEGLPEEIVVARGQEGRVAVLKQSVISGFVLLDRFFTREQAATEVRKNSSI